MDIEVEHCTTYIRCLLNIGTRISKKNGGMDLKTGAKFSSPIDALLHYY